MSTKHDVHALDVAAVLAVESIKACILCFVAVVAFVYYFCKVFFAPAQAKPASTASTATPTKPHVQPLYEMSTELQKHTLKELYAITAIHKKVAKHKLIAMYAAG